MVGGVVLLSLLTDINAFLIYTYLLITTVLLVFILEKIPTPILTLQFTYINIIRFVA